MSSMDDALTAFLDAAAMAVRLLELPEVAGHWNQASVLREFSVAGLAGHLFRGMSTVERYLDEPEPSEAGISAAGISAASYFDTVIRSADVSDPANQAIRARGEEAAAGGPAALASDAWTTLERLTSRLAGEGPERQVRVAGGLVMTLDEYLRTRVVELVVHADDLGASVGIEPEPPQPTTTGVAIDVLVGVARIRQGDMAVLRALARRERDTVGALRVL
jgi:mycothiol maleylpyruvate isomerase-like protein